MDILFLSNDTFRIALGVIIGIGLIFIGRATLVPRLKRGRNYKLLAYREYAGGKNYCALESHSGNKAEIKVFTNVKFIGEKPTETTPGLYNTPDYRAMKDEKDVLKLKLIDSV